MKHYGDITKIHGDAVETVDIITGGSPCQGPCPLYEEEDDAGRLD